MLFKRKKLKEEKINQTKEKIKKIFQKNIEDYENYNLVYAYNREFSPPVNDYVYTSLILGYSFDNMCLVILEVDKEIENVFNIIKLGKKDFTKAIYSKQMDEYIIYLNNKKTDKINFSLITENYIDIDILAYIEQSIEVEDFKDFYIDFKKKPRTKIKKKMKKEM